MANFWPSDDRRGLIVGAVSFFMPNPWPSESFETEAIVSPRRSPHRSADVNASDFEIYGYIANFFYPMNSTAHPHPSFTAYCFDGALTC